MLRYFLLSVLLFYTFLLHAQNFTSSNLPIVIIDTQGQRIVDEPKITVMMKVLNSGGTNYIDDTNHEYFGYIGIEIRGNTSQMFDKKSFSFETRDVNGENLNVSLMGLPEENDWVLQGPYADKSLVRNVFAYHLGNSQGRWSPRTRFCEVLINDEYRGIYVLVEKIKIDKNRVDIATLQPEDNSGDELTGGYIMSIDRDNPGSWNSPFLGRTGSVDVPFSYEDPKYDELTNTQRQYIRDYITAFETALHGPYFKDSILGYRPYVDIISFIDYLIMTELSRDLDGYRVSVYFHKDKDSKGGRLVMSPLWDYNLGFGNGNFMEAHNPVGWTADGIGNGDWYEVPFWWDRFREDPYFDTHLKYRWNELRESTFSKEYIFAFIDSCTNVLEQARVRNFQKFNILNSYVWPNPYIGVTYENEIIYLKNWISDRIDWLDSQIDLIEPSFEPVGTNAIAAMGNTVSAYPNPFAHDLSVQVKLKQSAQVQLDVFTLTGEKITSQSKVCLPGKNIFRVDDLWFGRRNGIYFYVVKINGEFAGRGKLLRN
ncbi:MAG: CotH kinase family protein [Prolixibacteraceae bacterium]|jgi:hypothetical protein|nr:CotH kinase family protein [Prolixibacteraceae bacterium]